MSMGFSMFSMFLFPDKDRLTSSFPFSFFFDPCVICVWLSISKNEEDFPYTFHLILMKSRTHFYNYKIFQIC